MAGRDPLLPDEYLLRRITAFKYDPTLSFPIPPEHFQPNARDTDGLSFFQESATTPAALANSPNKHGWLIARVSVRELREIGLNPVPTGASGHVSVPELSSANFRLNRNEVDLLKLKLAKLAAARIVLRSDPKS